MVTKSGSNLGFIRGYADPGYKALILDSTGMFGGTSIRTAVTQGPTLLGGNADKFAINCTGQTTTMQRVNITLDQTYNKVSQENSSSPLLAVSRYGLSGTSSNFSQLATFLQETNKVPEDITIAIGGKTRSLVGALGYNFQSVYTSDRLWLGFTPPSNYFTAPVKCIQFTPSGEVEVPTKLTASTIRATTYENLPSVPPAQLLPLTLDNTQKHVGINNTNPAQALDVVGNIKATGSVIADTVQATNWVGLPPVDLAPITLDKVGGNVGINNPNPQFDLDVNGAINCQALQTNDVIINALAPGRRGLYVAGEVEFPSLTKQDQPSILSYDHTSGKVYYADKPSTDLTPITLDPVQNRVGIRQTSPQTDLDVNGTMSTNFLLLQRIPNVVQPDVLMYDPLTKAVSYGPAPSPTPDLLPITLDKTNSRVGINNASPTQALDITGAARMDRLFVKGTLANQGLIFTDTTNNRVGIGTITPATALDVMGTTTSTNLQLTGIANSVKPNVLMYDPTTKAVSYGAAPSSSPTFAREELAADKSIGTNVSTTVMSVSLTPGIYMFTYALVYQVPALVSSVQSYIQVGADRLGQFFDDSITANSVNARTITTQFQIMSTTTVNVTMVLSHGGTLFKTISWMGGGSRYAYTKLA
jgi:hypothetical protein